MPRVMKMFPMGFVERFTVLGSGGGGGGRGGGVSARTQPLDITG